MKLKSSLTSHLRLSMFVLEALKFEWQRSQYLELNPTCVAETLHLEKGRKVENVQGI